MAKELNSVLEEHVWKLAETDLQRKVLEKAIEDGEKGIRAIFSRIITEGGSLDSDPELFADGVMDGVHAILTEEEREAWNQLLPTSIYNPEDGPKSQEYAIRKRIIQIAKLTAKGRMRVETVLDPEPVARVVDEPPQQSIAIPFKKAATCLRAYQDGLKEGEDPKTVQPYLDRAFELVEDAALAVEISMAYFEQDDQEKAIKILMRALEYAERNKEANYAQAVAQTFEEELKEESLIKKYAVEAYYRTSKLTEDEGVLEVIVNKMIHYEEAEKAVEVANHAVDLSNDKDFIWGMAHYLHAKLEEKSGTAHSYCRAFEVAPKDTAGTDLKILADRLKEAGDHETANKVLTLLLARVIKNYQDLNEQVVAKDGEFEAQLAEKDRLIASLQNAVRELQENMYGPAASESADQPAAAPLPILTPQPKAPAPTPQPTAPTPAPAPKAEELGRENFQNAEKALKTKSYENALMEIGEALKADYITPEVISTAYQVLVKKAVQDQKSIREIYDDFAKSLLQDGSSEKVMALLEDLAAEACLEERQHTGLEEKEDTLNILEYRFFARALDTDPTKMKQFFQMIFDYCHHKYRGDRQSMESHIVEIAARLGIPFEKRMFSKTELYKQFEEYKPSKNPLLDQWIEKWQAKKESTPAPASQLPPQPAPQSATDSSTWRATLDKKPGQPTNPTVTKQYPVPPPEEVLPPQAEARLTPGGEFLPPVDEKSQDDYFVQEMGKASAAMKAGKWQEAETHLKTALLVHKDNKEVQKRLFDLYVKQFGDGNRTTQIFINTLVELGFSTNEAGDILMAITQKEE